MDLLGRKTGACLPPSAALIYFSIVYSRLEMRAQVDLMQVWKQAARI